MPARRLLLVTLLLVALAAAATFVLTRHDPAADLPGARNADRTEEPERNARAGGDPVGVDTRERVEVASRVAEGAAVAADVATTDWEFPPIRGRVVWRGGTGWDADACVVAHRRTPEHLRSRMFAAEPADGAEPAATSTVGTDGSFTLDVRGGGTFTVSLEHPAAVAPPARGVSPGRTVTLDAYPAATLGGRVVAAESGVAIARADVRVFDDGPEDFHRTHTDDDGRFEVRGLVPGAGGVFALADGYAKSRYVDLELEAEGALDVELELGPGRSLVGVVRDARTHTPLEDAEVSTWSFIGRNARTDADGAFVVWGAGRRNGALTVRAAGYAPREVRFGADDERVDVELERAHVIRGRLVHASGRPAGDASLMVRSLWEDETWAYFLGEVRGPDADGAFEVRGTAQRFELLARHLRPGSQVLERVDTTRLPAGEDGALDVGTLVLQPTVTVVGRVVSAGGDPVTGAHVTLVSPPGSTSPPHGSQRTDTTGVVRLLYVEEGLRKVRLVAPHRSPVEIEFDARLPEAPGAEQQVEWRLPPGSLFAGRVVDDEGRAVEGATVGLRFEGAARGPWVRTDTGGLFEFSDVTAEIARVRVSPPGSAADALLPATLEPGADTEVEIVLRRLGPRLTGRVVDGEGRGVAQVFVALVATDGPIGSGALTGEDGTFELVGPVRGSIDVGAWRTRALRADDRNIDVREHAFERRIVGRSEPAAARARAEAGATDLRLALPPD